MSGTVTPVATYVPSAGIGAENLAASSLGRDSGFLVVGLAANFEFTHDSLRERLGALARSRAFRADPA
jgi:hypothetical protein